MSDPSAERPGAPDEHFIIGRRASEIESKPNAVLSRPHDVREWRRCNCYRGHRTLPAFASCLFRRAYWVDGEGEWGSVAHCRVTTVKLFQSEDKARQALRGIDSDGCGGGCVGYPGHELVRLMPS
jgi:hypothetical protein